MLSEFLISKVVLIRAKDVIATCLSRCLGCHLRRARSDSLGKLAPILLGSCRGAPALGTGSLVRVLRGGRCPASKFSKLQLQSIHRDRNTPGELRDPAVSVPSFLFTVSVYNRVLRPVQGLSFGLLFLFTTDVLHWSCVCTSKLQPSRSQAKLPALVSSL